MKPLLLLLALLPALCSAQTVCIDPGHISEVGAGTKGRKTTELKVAWEVAQLLKERLAQKGITTVLTKSKIDQKVLNRERSAIANKNKVDLMVRLHCDAAAGSGFAVYYPSRKGTARGVTGPSQAVLTRSKAAANRFHAAMAKTLAGSLKDNGLKTDLATAIGAKQGALTGSIHSQVPVLLVEMVVLTNPKDEAFVVSRSGRAALVEALTQGVLAAVRR